MLGNPYGACLHWVMATILDEKAKSGNGERIAFFHETNDFKREAWDTFEHMERQYNPLGCRMSFAFGRKDEFVPLQAADVLAYEANKRIRSSKNRNRRALDALHPESGYLDLRLYDRENLPFLIARMEAARLQEEAG